MFEKKIHTIPFREFMDGTWKKESNLVTTIAGIGMTSHLLFGASPTHAMGVGDIIMKSFEPIINLIQGVSYPIAFIMVSGGFILIMTGQTSRGMHFIKWACMGYIGLQFAPAIMQIIVQVGQGITKEVGAFG